MEPQALTIEELAGLQDVDAFLRQLKSECERFWGIDPHVALRFADALIQSARLADQPNHVALGLMARADSLRYLGRYPESDVFFAQAAQMFISLGDEVGWARTCIGSLITSHRLGRPNEKLIDAERAHEILVRREEWLRAAGLDLNAGQICVQLGRYARAGQLYDRALEFYARARVADPSLADTAELRAAKATSNKASLLVVLGDSRAALPLHETARQVFVRHGDTLPALRELHNIARVHLDRVILRAPCGCSTRHSRAPSKPDWTTRPAGLRSTWPSVICALIGTPKHSIWPNRVSFDSSGVAHQPRQPKPASTGVWLTPAWALATKRSSCSTWLRTCSRLQDWSVSRVWRHSNAAVFSWRAEITPRRGPKRVGRTRSLRRTV